MKKNVSIVVIMVVAIAVVVALKLKKSGDASSADVAVVATEIVTNPEVAEVESGTTGAEVALPLPRLVDLGAGKCIPCKKMAPILDELKETFAGQINVEFIDVWENQSAGQQYGIRMIPTQIFYDAEGKELYRHEGFYAREDMVAKWAEFGVVLKDTLSMD